MIVSDSSGEHLTASPATAHVIISHTLRHSGLLHGSRGQCFVPPAGSTYPKQNLIGFQVSFFLSSVSTTLVVSIRFLGSQLIALDMVKLPVIGP